MLVRRVRAALAAAGGARRALLAPPPPPPLCAPRRMAEAAEAAPADAAPSRAMRIYTKTGDAGTSSLYNGARRPKEAAHFAALGDVDELSGHLGLAREHLRVLGLAAAAAAAADASAASAAEAAAEAAATAAAAAAAELGAQLAETQSRLLDVGSAIATPEGSSRPDQLARARFASAPCTAALERWIDALDARLPPLRNFILPSGGLAASQLHVARSVCRRAERAAFALVRERELDAGVAVYLNRLSDYLFMAARAASRAAGGEETVYKKAADEGAGAAGAAAAPEAPAQTQAQAQADAGSV